ncbi:MAG: hypothetical protein ACOY3F_06545 [Bacillota bacterium]
MLLITDELFGESWMEGYRTKQVATTLRAVCCALPRELGREASPFVQADGEGSAVPDAGEGQN